MQHKMNHSSDGAILVRINPRLSDLVTNFLDHRNSDLTKLRTALETGDLELIRHLGHDMQGTGGTFGFDRMTSIGGSLERAASANEPSVIEDLLDQLAEYLSRVQVIYE